MKEMEVETCTLMMKNGDSWLLVRTARGRRFLFSSDGCWCGGDDCRCGGALLHCWFVCRRLCWWLLERWFAFIGVNKEVQCAIAVLDVAVSGSIMEVAGAVAGEIGGDDCVEDGHGG